VYSDFGDAAFCAFPSNDFGFPPEGRPEPLTPGIWTVDRTGRAGYNPDPDTGDVAGDIGLKYTNGFGGTSSACPGAAGVAALVISRNPALRRQEVKEILRQACDRIDPQGGDYDARGHSKKYGYGRLNAEAAVRLAVPAAGPPTIRIERSFTEPISDFQTSTVQLDVAETARLVDVRVSVDIEHTYIGDLVVTVIPPAAMGADPVVLHRRTGGRTVNLRRIYDGVVTPALLAYAGKSPKGTWTLEVRDEARIDTGTIRQFGLALAVSEGRVRRASPRARAPRPAAARRRRPTRRAR
jgi:subtilisin-like proprotein convertase family protein